MGNEAIVIPIVIDPKAGVAGLKAVGDQAARTNTVLNQGSTTGGKFADSMKNIGKNALLALGGTTLLVGGVKILAEGLLQAVIGQERLASSAKLLSDAQKKAMESTREEAVSLQTLFAVAKDVSLSYGQRQAAIDKINKSYPELHKNIKLENIGTKETAAAIQSVINNLVAKAKLQLIIAEIAKLSNLADQASEDLKKINIGPLRREQLRYIEQLNERMETLGKTAEKIQGQTIGEKFFGNDLGKAFGDIEIPKITPKKVVVEPKKAELRFTDYKIEGLLNKTGIDRGGLAAYFQGLQDEINRNRKYDLSVNIADKQGIGYAAQIEKANKAYAELIANGEKLSAQVNGYLAPAFESLFDSILTKQDAMKAFFDSLVQAVQQLIKQLIRAAVQAVFLSILTGGAKSGGLSFGKAFSKILGFADGGLVTGPVSALVGEGSGTNSRNPEVVAPLDRLKTFFADMIMPNRGYNASGMGTSGAILNMPKEVILRASGKDMLGVITLEQLSQGRTG